MMEELSGHSLYSCNKCRTPIALRDDLLSKKFMAQSGQAYFFSQAMNIVMGPNQERQLITGRFVIADIYCENCGEVMGWKYLRAYEKSQKFKEGRFIIEKAKILKMNIQVGSWVVQVGVQQFVVFMGEIMVGPRIYSCYNCRNHVSLHDDIISKDFQGKNGRAFLFSHAMNIVLGTKEDRYLLTGLHTIADIHCADCSKVLGWKYERAYNPTQKYKEGKFIFEKIKIAKENW